MFIIPPTPKRRLAKTFKKICTEELKGTNISIAVTERGGKTLGQDKSWAAECQARVRRSTAKEGNASHAILGNWECAGKLDLATRLNAWCAASN